MKFHHALLLLTLLSSCMLHPKNQSDDEYLRRQLTPDKKHYIYDYAREGTFVTSNEITGRRLIAINQPFSEDAGVDVTGLIDHWANDTLVIYVYSTDYEYPKDTAIIKTEYKSFDGLTIKKIYEEPVVGGGYEDSFDFDSVKIENNRIRFYGAGDKFSHKSSSRKEISFPTGEVSVYSKADSVIKIEIDKQYKSMAFSRIDASGKWIYHQPEVVINSIEFTPRKK